MLAHAINKTSAALHMSSFRCDEYSFCIAWMPAPPGVSTRCARPNAARSFSEEYVRVVASTCRSKPLNFA